MRVEDGQKRRAENLIWNAAEDYELKPGIKAYDENGQAQLYWNSIIGVVYKAYEWELLQALFDSFQGLNRQECYENLLWLGLENGAYEKEVSKRPALSALRMEYARTMTTKNRRAAESGSLTERLEWLHFMEVLGEEPQMSKQERALLKGLAFTEEMTTGEVVTRTGNLFAHQFGYQPVGERTVDAKNAWRCWWEKVQYRQRRNRRGALSPIRRLSFGYGEYTREETELEEGKRRKLAFQLPTLSTQTEEGLRQYIQDYFGTPLYDQPEIARLEKQYCTGNHQFCHLHVTNGGYDSRKLAEGYAGMRKRDALEQIDANRAYYDAHRAVSYQAIMRLTNRIRNSLLAKMDSYEIRADHGQIVPSRIWRGIHLEERKLFEKEIRGSSGNLSVDLLLDASISQLNRQEIVATQGYIIAESLTRCQIPVRVYSFCSMSGYTVINQFRDYGETGENEKIFNFFTSGCNRDGLAIRAAAGMLARNSYDHKLLIVLSDAKPNDVLKVEVERNRYENYAEDVGVEDTAREVHQARMNDIQVVCVFTGEDQDLDNARKIYGRGLARIRSLEQFADTVGTILGA